MRTAFVLATFALAACDKPPAAAPTPQAAVAPAAPTEQAAPSEPSTPSTDRPGEHPSMGPATPNEPLPAGHPPVGMPAGHPPIDGGMPAGGGAAMGPGGPMNAAVPAETGVTRPLPLEGSGSIAELKARLAKVKDAAKHPILEEAFRKTFTVERQSRDYAGAETALTPLASDADPAVAALAERTLGYVRVNTNFDQEGAKARYARAIELDPDYGEAHYALAFMYAMGDREKGKTHFDKAMALGVPDTRGLKAQFYGGQ